MEALPSINRSAQMASEPSAVTASRQEILAEVIHDDGRSSSLSDIDDRLDSENIDFSPQKLISEVDSEAETERIEDSPHRIRNKASIVLSAATYGASPSKLAQSTTYDDLQDDDNETEASPSKPPRSTKSNGIIDHDDSKHSSPDEAAGRKRKRIASAGDVNETQTQDEPSRKRRGSLPAHKVTDQNSLDLPSRLAVTEPAPSASEALNDETHTGDHGQEAETRPSPVKGKKGKKVEAKRTSRRTRNNQDDTEIESNPPENNGNGVGDEPQVEDEDNAETVDDGDEVEATSKQEESMKKTHAMGTLTSLEQQFATLRDRVYDERIANLNNELAQLEQPNPTHPEYLRQIEISEQYRDSKIKHENILFSYKLDSLRTRAKVERSQINSTYFQRIREVRESHLENASQQHCQIQQDRFQTNDASSEFSVPFPTRRSKQISQQAAYNTEVSVLAGFAKFVGFPASPAIQSARQQEIEDDFEKMGLRPSAQYTAGSTENPHG